jgi:hypothetical protein
MLHFLSQRERGKLAGFRKRVESGRKGLGFRSQDLGGQKGDRIRDTEKAKKRIHFDLQSKGDGFRKNLQTKVRSKTRRAILSSSES